ncbi:MarR family winged helix-turn-helix transcriptional regulator [Paenibacillus hodogayensis]|uniref:MarR family winged helix-turn-helix transcriptional regulator n=1 Tax=Paenibacillus hodogayensis TaxID=279208 RepID=A0ABV5W0X8_9BACL
MEPTNNPEIPLMGLIARLMRQHHYNSHLSLKDQDVHPGQPPLLFALSRNDGLRQNELAEKMLVKPATVTVMLNRMVKNGLVERRTDPQDQRVSRVYLTDKGRSAVKEVRAALQASEAQALEGLSDEDKLLLRRLLTHMYDNVKRHGQTAVRQAQEEKPDGTSSGTISD